MWDIIEFNRENEGQIVDVKTFAETIGAHSTTIKRWTQTHYQIPTKIFKKACDLYRINPTYVILGEGERFLDNSYQEVVLESKRQKEKERIRKRREIKKEITKYMNELKALE